MIEKIQYNRNYFEKIDTEEKAYWCGYLLGDGTIYGKRNPRVTLECNEKDKELVYNFARAINIDFKYIKYRKEHNSFSLQLYSREMVRDLFRMGIPEKDKSLNSKWINFKDQNYQKAFALGLFDADGSFSQKENSLAIALSAGHPQILKDFSDFLAMGGKIFKSSPDHRVWWQWVLYLSDSVKMQKLYDNLYRNTPFYPLKRKREKLKKGIERRILYEDININSS